MLRISSCLHLLIHQSNVLKVFVFLGLDSSFDTPTRYVGSHKFLTLLNSMLVWTFTICVMVGLALYLFRQAAPLLGVGRLRISNWNLVTIVSYLIFCVIGS